MGNYNNASSYESQTHVAFKRAWIDFYARQNFTHVLTICWNTDFIATRLNSSARIAVARADIGKLLARIDRKLLGTRFNRKPEQRTKAVFHFEHLDSNIHAHALVQVQPGNLLNFHRLFPKERGGVWNKVVPAGTYHLEIINDIRTTAGYLLKAQSISSTDTMTVWADEFFAR